MNGKDFEQPKSGVTKSAKGLKSKADLGDLVQRLMKMTVDTALGAELDDHLGDDQHDLAGRGSGNSCNDTEAGLLRAFRGVLARRRNALLEMID
ncbi:MAG: hypothetical protein P1U78_04900 [Alcanivoracaceae bacterium]|nr:hypothetical protein [Alcanivoracaceae bacterium]